MDYLYNDNIINYHIYGGGYKTILLIHDIGTSSCDFNRLINKLSSRAKLITIDLCGHGQSYIPRSTVSLKTMAREIVNFLLDCYIGKVDVVAAGVGGAVALEAYNMFERIFGSFVFLDTFICKTVWQQFSEHVRPFNDQEKYKRFRDIFKRWIPAIREDFFIFCDEFDGRDIFKLSRNRMLFVYGDRGKNLVVTKSSMNLPAFTNVDIFLINGADRSMLENNYKDVETIIIKYLFDYEEGWNSEEGEKNTDDSEPDISNLMYLR